MTNFFSKCSKCINMHQNASKCMQNEMCKCFVHEIIQEGGFTTHKLAKIDDFPCKNRIFCSKCSECINMHQNASKCVQNEMCKCFVHENIKKWVYIAFKGAKISKLLFTICIRTPSITSKFLLIKIHFITNFVFQVNYKLESAN